MSLPDLHLDGETRSALDLKKVGAYVYFEHDSTDVWCCAYAFGDEEPKLWVPGQPCPPEIVDHVLAGGRILAWNAAFERQMWKHILRKKHGWPKADDSQFMCTMVEAMTMNLPGKLDDAAPALGMTIIKDDTGHRLMLQMCKPRKPRKGEHPLAIFWWDEPEKQQRLGQYCLQDVRVEQGVGKRVLRLHPNEQKLFYLDAKINDRGVFIDEPLCLQAKKIITPLLAKLDQHMRDATDGAVAGANNVAQLVAWLQKRGIETKSVAKDIITDLLVLDIPDDCRRALEIRQEAAKTSVAKIDKMLMMRCKDGRMRGNLQFYGATQTGRWAGRGAQLQNLPRPVFLKGETQEEIEEQVERAVKAVMTGAPAMMEMLYERPLSIISDLLRSFILAGPGNHKMAADFSNIEGRGVAWLGGQEDKLDAFRAYDNGTGPDLYLVAAGGVFGLPAKDAKPHRQIGKVCELSLGYQGGPIAFAKMGKNYGLKIGEKFDIVWKNASDDNKSAAMDAWELRGKSSGMEEHAWLAAEVIKRAWRAKNHRIAAYWKECETAAKDAVSNPGNVYAAGKVKYRVAKPGPFLWCQLPSGRVLAYPYPRFGQMMNVKLKDGTELTLPKNDAYKIEFDGKGEIESEAPPRLLYKAVDQYTKKWGDKAFYGGLAVENITQAISRDIMAEAMLRVEQAGYEIVLTVHDEVLSEIPASFGSQEEFNDLMVELPAWAQGFPISAAGWRGKRYRKG